MQRCESTIGSISVIMKKYAPDYKINNLNHMSKQETEHIQCSDSCMMWCVGITTNKSSQKYTTVGGIFSIKRLHVIRYFRAKIHHTIVVGSLCFNAQT